ncbi:MAG: glycosyltransferase [Candidatus Eremiobacteraeota bacterium]|nr:glycosyltransferase [Candidatus Eremiobacteraeota bacterium]MBV8365513.1 glycosyltransferase [Candidatus Eremiobacteraeota bacterium]
MLAASPRLVRSSLAKLRDFPQVLYLGSYPPRECGIATFTRDVKAALDDRAGTRGHVMAVNELGENHAYASDVIGAIERDDPDSYLHAARVINAHPADVVNVQHEYGLFGGERGAHLLELLSRLTKPAVTTLHTVLPQPDAVLRRVTRELCNHSSAVVVMSYTARHTLAHHYGVDPRKICVIMHGVPDVPLRSSRHFKRRLGLPGKTIISTFGLIGPDKGIEYLIEALPAIFARHPNAVYVMLGETHPGIRRHSGEAYRDSLAQRVHELGIGDRVFFENRYLADEEIVSALLATDVYVSPSLDPNQAVSGTLSYAVAAGRVVVATSTAYARELLAEGRGMVVPLRDSEALVDAIDAVLDDSDVRRAIEVAAYRFGRRMIWRNVAREYEHALDHGRRLDERHVVRSFGRPTVLLAPARPAREPITIGNS